jgi:heme oxygenase
VEAVADLPGSVSNPADYAELLATFHTIHVEVEAAVCAPEWAADWRELGVDISAHRQQHLLADDLARLGRPVTEHPVTDQPHADGRPGSPLLTSGAEALGALYVIEGSAIGRRVLSPMLRARIGNVPTRFFDDRARSPQAWRDVQRCLAGAADHPGRQQEILAGARTTFRVFLHGLSERATLRTDVTCR